MVGAGGGAGRGIKRLDPEGPHFPPTRPSALAMCAPPTPTTAAPTHSAEPSRIFCHLTVPRSKKAEGQARKLAAKEAKVAKEEAAQAAIEDAEWEVGGKKANKKQEADAAKKAAKAERKAEADAQVRWPPWLR